jgi:hypothetical protein
MSYLLGDRDKSVRSDSARGDTTGVGYRPTGTLQPMIGAGRATRFATKIIAARS